jgi:AcrR family transcriptional regulator
VGKTDISVSKMVGTLSPQAEARRDEILEVALGVISRKGFHRTSIADIAGGARVSRATVYQYFADKRDILVALADRIARRIIDAADSWAPLPTDLSGAGLEAEPHAVGDQVGIALIHTRVSRILEAIVANGDAARLVVRLTRGNDRLVDDTLRRIDDHIVGILTRDIETAKERGWVRPCDARTIARFLLGGLEKIVMDTFDREDAPALDGNAIAGEMAAFVFFGLAQRDPVVAPPSRSP